MNVAQRPTLDAQLAHQASLQRLVQQFGSDFETATIDAFLTSAYEEFSSRATVLVHVPLLAERFTADRLTALAKIEEKAHTGVPMILFLCEHDMGRSQMALAWLRRMATGRALGWSGGNQPGTRLNPLAVEVMAELEMDISMEHPKPWTPEIVQAADVIVTVGGDHKAQHVAGKVYQDWSEQPLTPSLEDARRIRDELGQHVRDLLLDLNIPIVVS